MDDDKDSIPILLRTNNSFFSDFAVTRSSIWELLKARGSRASSNWMTTSAFSITASKFGSSGFKRTGASSSSSKTTALEVAAGAGLALLAPTRVDTPTSPAVSSSGSSSADTWSFLASLRFCFSSAAFRGVVSYRRLGEGQQLTILRCSATSARI